MRNGLAETHFFFIVHYVFQWLFFIYSFFFVWFLVLGVFFFFGLCTSVHFEIILFQHCSTLLSHFILCNSGGFEMVELFQSDIKLIHELTFIWNLCKCYNAHQLIYVKSKNSLLDLKKKNHFLCFILCYASNKDCKP